MSKSSLGLSVAISFFVAVGANVESATRALAAITESEKIIPTPHEVTYTENSLTLFNGTSFSACILVGKNAVQAEWDAAYVLETRISRQCGNSIPIVREDQNYSTYSVVLSIGTVTTSNVNSDLVKSGSPSLPDYDEGYLIKKVTKGNQTVMVMAGRESIGSYYAAASLSQMIFGSGKEVILREIEVRDWPDIAIRSIKNMNSPEGHFSDEDDVDWMSLLPKMKVNNWGLCYTKTLPNWRNPSAKYLAHIKELANYSRDRGTIQMMHLLNPGYTGGQPTNAAEKTKLLDLFKTSLDEGANSIMLAFDDQGSEDPTAHRDLANYIYAGTKGKPGFHMIVCPQPYNFTYPNIGTYLSGFTNGLDSAIDVIWTGDGIFSDKVTPAIVNTWKGYTSPKNSRNPFYWQNDPPLINARLNNNWLPDNDTFKDKRVFLNGLDLVNGGYIWSKMPEYNSNGVIENIFREATQFKVYAITYADWAWNPGAYKNDVNTFNRAKRYWDDNLANPAFKQPATASSSAPDYGPELAVDGLNNNAINQNNAWATQAGQATVNAWWQVDLGLKQYMSGVAVRFREYLVDKAYLVPKSITVQVSNDNVTWSTKVAKSTNVPAEGAAYMSQAYSFKFEADTRYVKLLFEDGAQNTAINMIELTEVEVLTERPLGPPVVTVNTNPPKAAALTGYKVDPISTSGIINYRLPVGGEVNIDFYDPAGGHFASLEDKHQEAGDYSLRAPITTWAPGVYLQVFKSGTYVHRTKVSVLK